jgi:urease accessory protein
MTEMTAYVVHRAATGAVIDSVTLDFEGRYLRRRRLTTDAGRALVVDLPDATALADGDAFETLDGNLVSVRAAAEPLIEVRAHDPRHLARLAWHLGNRHLQVAVGDGWLRIKPDHVIEAMLEGLGARLIATETPFDPEGGAYGHGRTQAHGHAGAHHHDG